MKALGVLALLNAMKHSFTRHCNFVAAVRIARANSPANLFSLTMDQRELWRR
jgi:hypothetical protein